MKLILLICLIFLCVVNCSSENVPVVKVKQGLIRGIKEINLDGDEFYSYLGIPFAEPPVGKLRFKPPVSKSPWEGILDTNKIPPLCIQKDLYEVLVDDNSNVESVGQEDCLYLNVYTPKPDDSEANLPVMVFIHGGAFICGGASMYGPKALVNHEIILVVIQYRLGVFGFLSTADPILPGNMGLKDQQLALKWVKENIKEFGGNPDSITLFGESAGAASVHYQMLSPGSEGLFNRVILQSGNVLPKWASSKYNKKLAKDAGNTFGCSFSEGTETFLNCLQKVDARKLLDMSFTTSEWGINPLHILPRTDGEFLPLPPELLLKNKQYHKVDVMTGITKDEGSFILSWFTKNPSLMTRLRENFNKYGPLTLYLNKHSDSTELAERIYRHYLKENFNRISEDDKNLLELYTDAFFAYGHDTLINIIAEDPDITLYLYRIDHVGEYALTDLVPGFKRKNWVCHADELFYLFSGGIFFNTTLNDDDLKFRNIINSLWRNYAIKGKPTPEGSIIKWDKVNGPNELKQLVLTTSPKMTDYDYNEKRKFWRSLRTQQNILLGIYDSSNDLGTKTEL